MGVVWSDLKTYAEGTNPFIVGACVMYGMHCVLSGAELFVRWRLVRNQLEFLEKLRPHVGPSNRETGGPTSCFVKLRAFLEVSHLD